LQKKNTNNESTTRIMHHTLAAGAGATQGHVA